MCGMLSKTKRLDSAAVKAFQVEEKKRKKEREKERKVFTSSETPGPKSRRELTELLMQFQKIFSIINVDLRV